MTSASHPAPRHREQATDWRERLRLVVETMREMSRQTDPQAMVRAYGQRMRALVEFDRTVSISRRGLEYPFFRITRDSHWQNAINPWTEKGKLPLLKGGVIAEWIYSNEPWLLEDAGIDPADPAYPYLSEYRSIVAIPHYDQGESLNMVIHTRRAPQAFEAKSFPELVQMSNLFGRATHNLVLSRDLKAAYEALDRELAVVAEIQRSLLPVTLPTIDGLDLWAFYATSRRAGGDYYDLFPLQEGKWGILLADVSGHGTPAAVVMAIMHSIAHSYPGPAAPPRAMMNYLNQRLTLRYTETSGTFVTAFYGIYDPARRELTYTSAGHNPPRVLRAGASAVLGLEHARDLPLGIRAEEQYREHVQTLAPGDIVLFYTDGITEAWSPEGDMYGVQRLDSALQRAASLTDAAAMSAGGITAEHVTQTILHDLSSFTGTRAADDDRTILTAVVKP